MIVVFHLQLKNIVQLFNSLSSGLSSHIFKAAQNWYLTFTSNLDKLRYSHHNHYHHHQSWFRSVRLSLVLILAPQQNKSVVSTSTMAMERVRIVKTSWSNICQDKIPILLKRLPIRMISEPLPTAFTNWIPFRPMIPSIWINLGFFWTPRLNFLTPRQYFFSDFLTNFDCTCKVICHCSTWQNYSMLQIYDVCCFAVIYAVLKLYRFCLNPCTFAWSKN